MNTKTISSCGWYETLAYLLRKTIGNSQLRIKTRPGVCACGWLQDFFDTLCMHPPGIEDPKPALEPSWFRCRKGLPEPPQLQVLLTGVPVLVNTSFYRRCEPIICTPRDTVECFSGSVLEASAFRSFLLQMGAN